MVRKYFWSISVILGSLLAPSGFAQTPSLEQQCANQQTRDEALAVGGDELARFNALCGHNRLASESINLLRMNRNYLSRVIEELEHFKAKGAGRHTSAKSYAEYQDDGMCLQTEGIDRCIGRWKRARLDADAQIRRQVPKLNRARKELLSSQGQLEVLDVTTAGATIEGGVLYDLYSKSRANAQSIRAKDIDRAAISSHGSQVYNSNESYNAVSDVDVTDPHIALGLGIKGVPRPGIEVDSGARDEALNEAVEKVNQRVAAKYGLDTERATLAVQDAARQQKVYTGKLSAQIFKGLMDKMDVLIRDLDPKEYAGGLKKAPKGKIETLTIVNPITKNAVNRSLANDPKNAQGSDPNSPGRTPAKPTEQQILDGLQTLMDPTSP